MSTLNTINNGWRSYSVVLASIYAAIIICILMLLTHSAIITSRNAVLQNYAKGRFSNIEEVVFQIHKSLVAAQSERPGSCDDDDLSRLREIKRLYYFVGDIGKTFDGKIICTVTNGILGRPVELPPFTSQQTQELNTATIKR